MKDAAAQDENDVYLEEPAKHADASGLASANPSILSLPVRLTVSVGEARMTVSQLLALNSESILKLNSNIEDPVDLLIGDRIVGRGELVELEGETGGLGVRIISLTDNAGAGK